MAIVWHYTTADRLAGILAAGQIDPATAGVRGRERPVVWFSTRTDWEPTATKGVRDEAGRERTATRAEMVALGLARIGVDATGLVPWLQHRKVSGMSQDAARRLVTSGVGLGANPGDWLAHYGPVPRERWLAVQRWEAGVWVTAEGAR